MDRLKRVDQGSLVPPDRMVDATRKPGELDSRLKEVEGTYVSERTLVKKTPKAVAPTSRKEDAFTYPEVGDFGDILRGSFLFARDAAKILAPWRLPRFIRYFRNLRNEVDVSHVTFPSDGMDVTGVLCRPAAKKKLPTVVLSVGIDQKAEQFEKLITALAKQGYNVFAPDSRTSMSDKPVVDIAKGDVNDLVNAVKFLHDGKPWFDGRYAMFGGSIGGARSIIAAARMAEDPDFVGEKAKYKYPAAVVSMGSYADFGVEFDYLRWAVDTGKKAPEFALKWVPWCVQQGLTPENAPNEFKVRSPTDCIDRIPVRCPILIEHCRHDRVIPPRPYVNKPYEHPRELSGERPENTEVVMNIGGGIHTVIDSLLDVNPYRLRPRTFVGKFLSDLWTGHKTPSKALWYLVDDLMDVVGLGLSVYSIDRFVERNLGK